MATTTKIYSDIAGTTATSSGSEIRNVQDYSKFNKDATSTGTAPTFSVDSNGNGSAKFETDASITQSGSFTGNALIVGQNKSIYFENISDSDLTIGMEGNLTNQKGLSEVGNILSAVTTDKDLSTDERRSIVNYFSRKGGSQTEIYDYQAYDVNNKTPAVSLDFTGNGFYRNLPYYFRLGNTYASFADAFMGNSPKLTYSTTSNSTMTNSSGEIVWAPHNLEPDSNDITNYNVLDSASIIDSETFTTSGSSSDALTGRTISSADLNATYTVRAQIWSETDAGTAASFGVRAIGITDAVKSITLQSTPTWEELESDLTGATQFRGIKVGTTSAATIKIRNISVYRSDLGGMNPVPGAATGFEYYVPTNGAEEYMPRVGHHVYNGSTWVNEGLLIEEQRANLITNSTPQSGDLDVSSGSFSYVTCNFTPLSGPGIHFDDTGVTSYAYFTPTYTAADYTLSVFVEMDDGNAPVFGSASPSSSFNDFALVIEAGVPSPNSYNIEHVGGNTYRVSGTYASSSTIARNTGVIKYTNNSNRTFKVTGYQLEAGSFPTSYIPTSGSQVTRSADLASIPVSAFGYNQDAGTIVVEFSKMYPDAVYNRFHAGFGANSGNYIGMGYSSAQRAYVQPLVGEITISGASAPSPGEFATVAVGFDASGATSAVDGQSKNQTAIGSAPALSQSDTLYLGSSPFNAAAVIASGHIKSLQYYPRRLTDAQLQELTS